MFEEDPTLSDFFPWGFRKSKVYRGKIQDSSDLKRRIGKAVNEITPEMLVNVFCNVTNRYESCRDTDGAHVESNN